MRPRFRSEQAGEEALTRIGVIFRACPHSFLNPVSLLVIVAVCAVTAAMGGWRERIAAGAILLEVLAPAVLQKTEARLDPVLPLMVIDILLLAVLMGMAWRARRGWTIWAVGLQGLMVAIDGLKAVDIDMGVDTYLAALKLCTYGLTAVIAYAGWAAWRKGPAA